MKKYLFGISVIMFSIPFLVSARSWHHNRPLTHVNYQPPVNTPPVVVSPPVVPLSGLQVGIFNNGKQSPVGMTAFFLGDGDSFSEDVASLKISGSIIAYWESSYTAAQIASGKADSFLKLWASEMKAYPNQIIFVPLDEANGNWNPYSGNPIAYKAAWAHFAPMFLADKNVQLFYVANNDPSDLIESYYPGSQYISGCGIDGFDMGGQTWNQVFIRDNSIATIKSVCSNKPIWITSVGVVSSDNQNQFIKDMFAGIKTYGISGVIYFNAPGVGGNYTLNPTALSTFQSML